MKRRRSVRRKRQKASSFRDEILFWAVIVQTLTGLISLVYSLSR